MVVPLSMDKVCTKCGEEKPIEAFSLDYRGKTPKPRNECRVCSSHRAKTWNTTNPEVAAYRSKEWRGSKSKLELSLLNRTYDLRREYGMTPDEYKTLLFQQGGGCAICGNTPIWRALSVDHDHETGKVRGLLCMTCNIALGNMQDTPALLRKAADYLESF